jgi:hypothetical protein
MPVEIEPVAYACLLQFRLLLTALASPPNGVTAQTLSYLSVEDQQGRYKAWAGNLGALRRGRSSLDYRLRDASFVAENCTRLLKWLHQSLSRG